MAGSVGAPSCRAERRERGYLRIIIAMMWSPRRRAHGQGESYVIQATDVGQVDRNGESAGWARHAEEAVQRRWTGRDTAAVKDQDGNDGDDERCGISWWADGEE